MSPPTPPTHNKAHSIWTLLPNGYADPQRTRLRLALVVSLQAVTVNGVLGDLLELTDWPAELADLRQIKLYVEGQPGTVTATVTSEPPSSTLWRTLFRPDTPVQLAGGGAAGDLGEVGDLTAPVAYGPVVSTLREIYGGGDAALQGALRGLAAWSVRSGDGARAGAAVVRGADATTQDRLATLLDPTTLSTRTLASAAALLRERGLADAAAVVPLVSLLRRVTRSSGPATRRTDGEGPLDHIRTADEADFHQVLGLVAAQPELAVRLGLLLNLELPAFEGERTLRVKGPLPLLPVNGALWSRMTATRATGRFTMSSQPGAPTEITHGMLALRPSGPGADRHVFTTMDVTGATLALAGMAAETARGATPPKTPPHRRSAGVTLAQTDRITGLVQHTVARSSQIAGVIGAPDGHDPGARALANEPDATPGPVPVRPGEAVLYADDMTAGYRLDVRDGTGEWRSQMRRRVTYRVGDTRLVTADEGSIDPMTAVQQDDGVGGSQVEIGESLLTWEGWSPVVRRPGAAVAIGADGSVQAQVVPEQVSQRYPLQIGVRPEPGSLTPLRFGHDYQFRVRAVDPAGNSIAPELCDPALVSPVVRYRRADPVLPPELVLRRSMKAGEALERLVVRSTGDGQPLGGCERHLAAPRAWQQLAEQHGMFDVAFGPDTPDRAAARTRMLALGAIEAGAFTDLMVPDPADPTERIPAPGIRVAVNEDSSAPPTGSLDNLPRGAALPPGNYVVHDTDALNLPYLPDPPAAGVALALVGGPPGDLVTVPYGGSRPWPDVAPVRLIAEPTTAPGAATARAGTAAGRPTLTVAVPPAADITVELSSTLTPDGLAALDHDPPDAESRRRALLGRVPLITPAKRLRIVHAVRRPLPGLDVTAATADPARPIGATTVAVTGAARCHSASTAKLDVEANWSDIVDDGRSPVRTEQRTATIGSVPVDPGQDAVPWSMHQSFGDGRRHDVTYRVVGTTRFREYFPPATATAQLTRRSTTGVTTVVRNVTRPARPRVHSVLPIFRWTRGLADGTFTSTRETVGLRVWLERPWEQTGTGERLGVVVYADQASGDLAKAGPHPVHRQVSGWWGDALDGFGITQPHLVAESFPARKEIGALPKPANTAIARSVLAHEVRFDAERDLWYADVEFAVTTQHRYFPFVRLALVRHQPGSVPGCEFSPIEVTEPTQLPPRRTLTARTDPSGTVVLTVRGPWMNNTGFSATVCSRVAVPGGANPPDSDPHGGVIVVDTQTWRPFSPVDNTKYEFSCTATVEAQPEQNIVVREQQSGSWLYVPGTANRTTYLETLRRSLIP